MVSKNVKTFILRALKMLFIVTLIHFLGYIAMTENVDVIHRLPEIHDFEKQQI